MKSANTVSEKWASRAAAAAGDFVEGAQKTTKDQAAAAIAAIPIMKQALDAAFTRGAVAKGLQRSGKQGWLNRIVSVGQSRFAEGVSGSAAKYATESAKFDTARNAAAGMPKGLKGSPQNLAKVAKVVDALIKTKQG